MTLALTPTDQHAIALHAQQLLALALGSSLLTRGQVTAWVLELVELLLTDDDRATQRARLRALLPAYTPAARPAKAPRKARRVS